MKRTGLIVDDEQMNRFLFSSILEQIEITPVTVESGEKAIEYLRNNRNELLITDYEMDKVTGLDVLKEARLKNPQAHLIMVSGSSDHTLEGKAFLAGADHFFTKPVSCSTLIESILGNQEQ